MKALDPQSALNILAQATANMQGTRKDHETINAALQTLQRAITPAAPPQKTGPQGVAGKKSETSETGTTSESTATGEASEAPTPEAKA